MTGQRRQASPTGSRGAPTRQRRSSHLRAGDRPPHRRQQAGDGQGLPAVLLVPVIVVLLVAIGLVSRHPGVAAVVNPEMSRVSIESSMQFVTEQDIAGQVAPLLVDQGFFGIDVEAVKSALEEHPWIAGAAVKRIWPDQLSVRITEEMPIARWGDSHLLNQFGEVFTPLPAKGLPGLPVLKGPELAQKQMMERFKEFSELLFPYGLRVQELSLSERGSWSLQLSDGVRVVVGRDQVSERMHRFLKIYDSQIRNDIDLIESVDLRYPNGMAVRTSVVDANGVASR